MSVTQCSPVSQSMMESRTKLEFDSLYMANLANLCVLVDNGGHLFTTFLSGRAHT